MCWIELINCDASAEFLQSETNTDQVRLRIFVRLRNKSSTLFTGLGKSYEIRRFFCLRDGFGFQCGLDGLKFSGNFLTAFLEHSATIYITV